MSRSYPLLTVRRKSCVRDRVYRWFDDGEVDDAVNGDDGTGDDREPPIGGSAQRSPRRGRWDGYRSDRYTHTSVPSYIRSRAGDRWDAVYSDLVHGCRRYAPSRQVLERGIWFAFSQIHNQVRINDDGVVVAVPRYRRTKGRGWLPGVLPACDVFTDRFAWCASSRRLWVKRVDPHAGAEWFEVRAVDASGMSGCIVDSDAGLTAHLSRTDRVILVGAVAADAVTTAVTCGAKVESLRMQWWSQTFNGVVARRGRVR